VRETAEIVYENSGCLKDSANACSQEAVILNKEKSDNKIDKTFTRAIINKNKLEEDLV